MDRYIAPAISAFPTSLWVMQELEQCRGQLPRAPKAGAWGDAKPGFMTVVLGFIVFNPAYGRNCCEKKPNLTM